MKKFFSLIAAVLFAGSMLADEATIAKGTTNSYDNIKINGKSAVKMGKSGAGGNMTITVGAGATSLTFHAVAWKGEGNQTVTITAPTGVTIAPAQISVTANDALTGSGTAFTVTPEENYEFTFVITGASAETTFTLTSAKRAIVWGASYGTGEVTPVTSYYLVGEMNSWTPQAAYKFIANPGQEGEYMLETSFAAGDAFKVVGWDGLSENYTWYPEGTGNNYVVNEAGDYTVYFRTEWNNDWNNYYTAIKKVYPLYDVADALQAALTTNDVIEVRGIVTKLEFKGANFVKYGSVNIYVTDVNSGEGTFEFYNCYSLNADTFKTSSPGYESTSTTFTEFKSVTDANGIAVHVGDTVIAHGKYTLYNNTHELNTGCYLTEIKPAAGSDTPIEPETIEVNMSEGLYYRDCVEAEGWWQIYGDNAQYTVSISNVSTTQAEGTYTFADLDAEFTYVGIINGEDTTYIEFKSGSVTLSIAQNGDITVAGTLMGKDNNNYAFNLVFVTPKAQTTVNVTITNAELYDEYAEDGLYGVYGLDANNVYVQLGIWTEDGLQGQFSDQDLDFQYVGTYIEDGDEYVEIYSATITVDSDEEGGYTVTATLVGYNNKEYNVVMTIPVVIPTAETTVDVTVVDGQLYAAEGGFWAMGGDDIWVQLFIESATVEGQYSEGYLDMTQSAVFIGEEDYTEIYSATLTVVQSGDAYLLTGSILCYNNTQYNVQMILSDVPTGIAETIAAGKAAKVLRNGQLLIMKGDKTFNMTGARIR